jgi:hypothetical protein
VSADYWLSIDTGGDEPARITDPSFNVTYNLGPMLRAAGFPAWEALRGAPASEAAGVLKGVAGKLREDRAHLVAEFSPSNGWGDWDLALKFVEQFRDACTEHPKAVIEAWL